MGIVNTEMPSLRWGQRRTGHHCLGQITTVSANSPELVPFRNVESVLPGLHGRLKISFVKRESPDT